MEDLININELLEEEEENLSDFKRIIDDNKLNWEKPESTKTKIPSKLGKLISDYFKKNKLAILETFKYALTDSNFHSESKKVEAIIDLEKQKGEKEVSPNFDLSKNKQLKKIINKKKKQTFTSDYQEKVSDQEVLGVSIASCLDWNGYLILKSFLESLKESNHSVEFKKIESLLKKINSNDSEEEDLDDEEEEDLDDEEEEEDLDDEEEEEDLDDEEEEEEEDRDKPKKKEDKSDLFVKESNSLERHLKQMQYNKVEESRSQASSEDMRARIKKNKECKKQNKEFLMRAIRSFGGYRNYIESLKKNPYHKMPIPGDKTMNVLTNSKEESKSKNINEARTIGKINIRKLKKIVSQEYDKIKKWNNNPDYAELDKKIYDQIPEEWFDSWESAPAEIDRIIGDTLSSLSQGGNINESSLILNKISHDPLLKKHPVKSKKIFNKYIGLDKKDLIEIKYELIKTYEKYLNQLRGREGRVNPKILDWEYEKKRNNYYFHERVLSILIKEKTDHKTLEEKSYAEEMVNLAFNKAKLKNGKQSISKKDLKKASGIKDKPLVIEEESSKLKYDQWMIKNNY